MTLHALIASEMARLPGGMMTFCRWMELALYAPELGYYARGQEMVGKGGDFVTSVSVGPLFARLLAVEFEAMWQALGCPARFTLVEQGANGGEFVEDLLEAAERWPQWAAALEVFIVEPLPALTLRQKERLARWGSRVSWVRSLEALPRFTGVHFSNELVDAMPVHRVVWRGEGWQELYVRCGEEGRFEVVEGGVSSEELRNFLEVQQLPEVEGYTTEVNLAGARWMAEVAGRLERGYLLMADYGFSRRDFYLPQRVEGTLTAYRNHRRIPDPLDAPGETDLTAHVEFTSLAEAGEVAGLELVGFTDQHHYLVALGKRLFPDAVGAMTPEHQRDLRTFATLMHPSGMGRGFQFLAMAKGAGTTLPGFAFAGDPYRALRE